MTCFSCSRIFSALIAGSAAFVDLNVFEERPVPRKIDCAGIAVTVFGDLAFDCTLTAVAAGGIFLMVMSCMSIVLRWRPSVTVFVPPSTSVAVAVAAMRSVRLLPSFSVIAEVVVASSFAGSV